MIRSTSRMVPHCQRQHVHCDTTRAQITGLVLYRAPLTPPPASLLDTNSLASEVVLMTVASLKTATLLLQRLFDNHAGKLESRAERNAPPWRSRFPPSTRCSRLLGTTSSFFQVRLCAILGLAFGRRPFAGSARHSRSLVAIGPAFAGVQGWKALLVVPIALTRF